MCKYPILTYPKFYTIVPLRQMLLRSYATALYRLIGGFAKHMYLDAFVLFIRIYLLYASVVFIRNVYLSSLDGVVRACER